MSITYDSEKWSNPRREWDIGPMQSRSKSGMLVSLKDLAYFKSLSDNNKKAIFPFIEDT